MAWHGARAQRHGAWSTEHGVLVACTRYLVLEQFAPMDRDSAGPLLPWVTLVTFSCSTGYGICACTEYGVLGWRRVQRCMYSVPSIVWSRVWCGGGGGGRACWSSADFSTPVGLLLPCLDYGQNYGRCQTQSTPPHLPLAGPGTSAEIAQPTLAGFGRAGKNRQRGTQAARSASESLGTSTVINQCLIWTADGFKLPSAIQKPRPSGKHSIHKTPPTEYHLYGLPSSVPDFGQNTLLPYERSKASNCHNAGDFR